MIDLAKYAGVDDSNFAVKLSMVDKLICDKWDTGGPLVGVTYCKASQEEISNNKSELIDLASRIATRVEQGR